MARKRSYGTGQVYEKWGAYYGRWRTGDGRRLNRRIGPVRTVGSSDGLTRAQAEHAFRKLQDQEERRPRPAVGFARKTVDEAADSLRSRLALDGARKSYLQNCESMQRVHIRPAIGARTLEKVKRADIESLATGMLAKGLAPKSARNVLKFLHQVFEYGIEEGWCSGNPVREATRRRRGRRPRDANPDLQFLTVEEFEAVIRAIPDEVVHRKPAPTRRGRAGPAPPPPPDISGPVLRVLVLVAAMTGLRQSELLGLRWRDVDWQAQRIRVRNVYVRGEFSSDGKSDLSTRRSVPMADRVAAELDRWSRRTAFAGDDELVFAHPQTGRPMDPSNVLKRFKAACAAAAVRPVRFHDLRHTFATRLAGAGVSLRMIQEFLGHADAKTTQIYAHYAPSAHEVELVNGAFAVDGVQNGVQIERNGGGLSNTDLA